MAKLTDKNKALKKARSMGRKVIWSDREGVWHCATDRRNTPHWATEAIDVEEEAPMPKGGGN